MVCRDANTHKARPVNPLDISTQEEQSLFTMGEGEVSFPTFKLISHIWTHQGLKERRQYQARRSLSLVPPTSEEAQALHSFYLKYGQDDGRSTGLAENTEERVWMGDTHLEKTMIMFPQERKYVRWGEMNISN